MISKDDPPHEDTPPSLICETSLPAASEPANPTWPQEVTIKRFFWLTILLWSILIAVLAAMDHRQDKVTHMEIAVASARDTYSRDLVYRRWATAHGGVYVPATPDTPPNPNLSHIPERDIVTPSGKELTLISPASMTRQVHELGLAQYGIRGHITSLKPIRPENGPDAWERGAILAFERGEKAVSSIDSIDGQPYLRYMRPMITEPGCLKCHAIQGYTVGDIRGGISVSVPWEPHRLSLLGHLRATLLGFGIVWLIGLLGMRVVRISLLRSLSERRQWENALLHAKNVAESARNEWEATFDTIPDMVCLIDTNHRILRANRSMAERLGCSIEDIENHTCYEVMHGSSLPMVGCPFSIMLTTGEPVHKEFADERLGGIFEVIVAPFDEASGMLGGGIHVIRDITHRKHVEESLRKYEVEAREREVLAREAEERGILLDNIPTHVWYLTDELTYGAVNVAHAAFNGKRKEDLAFKCLHDIFPKEVADICQQGNIEVFTTGKLLRTEEWLPHISGEDRLLSIVKIPKLRADGSVEYIVCSGEDITERKRAERALQDSNEKLEAAVIKAEAATTAKSRFLTNMSHEIRTPLNAIIGFSQLMKGDPEISSEQRKRLEIIHRNGDHLLELINDILELSKIEAGRTALNPTSFDLHALFCDLTTIFQPRATDRSLSFIMDGLDQAPRYLITDELKLRQVLINLLGNAIKFTQTGEVRMRVGAESVQQDGTLLLVVWVEDTGPGIATEEMGLLFEVFEQTSTGRHSGRGTGLGLAISRRLAWIMGGDLIATSEIGKGSRFRLEIPAQKGIALMATEKTDPRRRFRLEAGHFPCRVLVVDDIEDSRAFLVLMLENAGFEVRGAADGWEAVAEFSRWRPQLVLMDKRVPNMNGDEAIERIRHSAGGDEVKIITMSADATDSVLKSTLAAGADAFMMKPFKIEEMFENIRVLTGVRYHSEKAAAPDESPIPPPALTWEMVESIPDQLRKQLHNAAVGCRQGRLFTLLEEITCIDPVLSEKLRNIIERLDYEALIELFDQGSRSDAVISILPLRPGEDGSAPS